MTDEELTRRRIDELGPWFHNMQLGGVWTAPEHFLGDYPNVKWQRFAHALPGGPERAHRARHRLQRRLLRDRDEAARRRRGWSRSTPTPTTWRRPGSRPRSPAPRSSSASSRSTTWAGSASGSTSSCSWACFYHLRHPLLALDLIHEHVAARPAGVPVDAARQRRGRAGRRGLPVLRRRAKFDRPGYPKLHFIEHSYAGDPTNWWVPNRACVEAMLRSAGFDILERAEEEVFVCRRRDGRVRPGRAARRLSSAGRESMIEAVMLWNEPNNKSHWAFEEDPDWAIFAEMTGPGEPGDRGREPAAGQGAGRHLADRSAVHPEHGRQGRAGRGRRRRGPRLPARLEPLADPRVAGQAQGDPGRHRPAGLGLGGRHLDLRRRGGAGVRPEAHGRAADRPRADDPLVQPLRPAARLARHHPPPRGRGLVLLPPLLHGPAARGRLAQAGAAALRRVRARARHLPVVPLRGSPARRRGAVAARPRRAPPAHRPELGRLLPPERAGLVRPADGGAGGVPRHRHLLLHARAQGRQPAPHQPARRAGRVRRVLRRPWSGATRRAARCTPSRARAAASPGVLHGL